MILTAANDKLKIHSIRFDYDFTYHSPYNTTDPTGIKSLFVLLTQFNNAILV